MIGVDQVVVRTSKESRAFTRRRLFGFNDVNGFDLLIISPQSNSDGYGITDLTVGAAVNSTVIPLPAGLPLLLGGMALLAGLRRRQ